MKRICCLMCLIWAIIPLMAAVRRETFDLISLLRMRSPLPGWIAAEITYSWALSQLPSRYSRTSPSHRLDPDLITSCLFLQSFKRSTRSLPEMISTHKHIKSQSIQQPTKYHSTTRTDSSAPTEPVDNYSILFHIPTPIQLQQSDPMAVHREGGVCGIEGARNRICHYI